MRTRLTLRGRGGHFHDVEVWAPTGTTLLDVRSPLAAAIAQLGVELPVAPKGWPAQVDAPELDAPGLDAPGLDGTVLWAGSRALPAVALVGGPGLRDGCIVGVNEPGPRDPIAHAVVRLEVVGGPDAGLMSALPRGMLTLGRGPECDIRLTDPAVSRRHIELTVGESRISVRDLGSSNGCRLLTADGSAPLDVGGESTDLGLGRYVGVGETVLCVASVGVPPAVTTLAEDGRLLVNRPPRLGANWPDRELQLPEHPPPVGRAGVPWLAALLPAVGGAGLAWFLHNAQFLAFAVLSPALMLATGIGDRITGRRARRRTHVDFRRRCAEAEQRVRAAHVEESRFRRAAHPDPAAVLGIAVTPNARIWERRRTDPDFLDVRLGLRDSPARLIVRRGGEVQSAVLLAALPIATSLQLGPLGLCGPRPLVLGVARWVVAQLATLHSPADVRIFAILPDDRADDWAWLRWLPHAASGATRASSTGAPPGSVVAARTAENRQALVAELLARLDAVTGSQAGPWTGAWIVVVIDRASANADLPGLGQLLSRGHLAGITALCIDDNDRRLPPACASVARMTGGVGSRIELRVRSADRLEREPGLPEPSGGPHDALADRVTREWVDRVARGLAPLADPGDDLATGLPAAVRLRSLLDPPGGLDTTAIRGRWSANDGCARTPIGVGADGVVEVDLGRDGPHVLVAGTTGAGKSELLQSLVVGLASHCHPMDLQFILIDYKGGAAFAECARLPHTAGLVTDLDAHLTQRALTSLSAELRRRERLFARASAVDLASYRRRPRDAADHIGRLVLVVDEFAALAEDLPDFVNGLIGIAQRGRSLGVHLILATQRPGGVVSPEIRANTALRIALRVTDPAESSDIIGCDDAARIDKHTPGRAIIRAGSTMRVVQIGRVAVAADLAGPSVHVVPLDGWGRRKGPAAGLEPEGDTDLMLMVDALGAAAAGFRGAAAARPWLDPLPDPVFLPAGSTPGDHLSTIRLGLIDRPAEQVQDALLLDVSAGSTLLLVGGPRSGRTSALRTLAARACYQLGVADLHLYAIDCAGAGLSCLTAFPHCGAVISRDAPTTIAALLARLHTTVAARQRRLADLGVGTMAEAANRGVVLPALLLVLDSWEGFLDAVEPVDGGRSADVLLALMRDGAAAGLTVVLTGDRGALSTRLSSSVGRRLILRLSDPADYAMAGLPRRSVPTSMPPGRCIDPSDGSEVQLGLLGTDAATAAQLGETERIAQRCRLRATSAGPAPQPFQVRALPSGVRLADLDVAAPAGHVVLGVGGDDAGPIWLRAASFDRDTADPRFLVAGPPRSGRSSVLRSVALQLVKGGAVRVVIAAGPATPLAAMARVLKLRLLAPDCTEFAPLEEDGPPGRAGRPTVLLIDDTELFLDTAAGEWLGGLVHSRPAGLAVFAAGRSEDLAMTFRGVAAEVKRARTGLVLQPGPGDGDLFGVHLSAGRARLPPGRGVLIAADLLLQPSPGAEDTDLGLLGVQVAQP